MEKKLKRVQRGAAVGFVVLKILRILLIIAAVLLVSALVFLALYNENKLDLENVQNGMLTLDFAQFGISGIPQVGSLIQDGVLQVELKDLKLLLITLLSAALLALAGVYVLLLVIGNLFKHMKSEDTPFTAGNIRRLRVLGALYLVFWACSIVLSYFVGSEFIRRLALPTEKVTLSLNLSAILIALLFFFLARLFSFGKAQGEALQAAKAAPVPGPVPEPAVEPIYEAPAVPVITPEPVEPEPAAEPVVEPVAEEIPEPVAEAVEVAAEEIKEDMPPEA